MNRTFTITDLILFAFNETELIDTALIVRSLESDEMLQDQFHEVKKTLLYIETLSLSPSDKSVEAILNYSRSKVKNVH
jgi:hypothetical protein